VALTFSSIFKDQQPLYVFSRLEISVLQESDQNIPAPISGMFLLSWIICGGISEGNYGELAEAVQRGAAP
jgi:hypothetical protein